MSEQTPWVPPDPAPVPPAVPAPNGEPARSSRRLVLVAAGVALLLLVLGAAVGFGVIRNGDTRTASTEPPAPSVSASATSSVAPQAVNPSTPPSAAARPTPSDPAPSAGTTVVRPHARVTGRLPRGTRFTDAKHGFSIIVPRDLDRVPQLKSVDAMWFVGSRHDGYQSNISVRIVPYPYEIPVDDLVRISEAAIKKGTAKYKRLSFHHDMTRSGSTATVLTYSFTLYGHPLRGQQYYILEHGKLAVVTLTATPDRLDGMAHRLKPYVRSISVTGAASSSAPQASA